MKFQNKNRTIRKLVLTGALIFLGAQVHANTIECHGKIMHCNFSHPDDGCYCPEDQADPAAIPDVTLDGPYRMEIKIGDKIYVDKMELRGLGKPLFMLRFGGDIEGTITVPGVFTSPLAGSGQCYLWSSICEFNFMIVAHEGGQAYKVFYHAELGRDNFLKAIDGKFPPTLTGTAKLENGQLLGSFEAVKQ